VEIHEEEDLTFKREYMRWVVLPINVVEYHQRLHERIERLRSTFEESPLNEVQGTGSYGVIAGGFAYQKFSDLFSGEIPPELSVMGVGTFHPLPERRLVRFLHGVESVLILEETQPLLENMVKVVAQEAGLRLPILGRDSGHIPWGGELFAPQIGAALARILPGLHLDMMGEYSRSRPSREPLCEGCPYIPTFDALDEVITKLGGREEVIVTGDPGCMVRAQGEPFYLMDVKNSLGAAIGMGAGLALSFARKGVDKHVVAICGDSGFLHSGMTGLIDASRLGARMLVLLLDNGTTALSGRQPHPASVVDAWGRNRLAVDLEELINGAGIRMVRVVDLDQGEDIRAAIEEGTHAEGVAVVIARGKCILM